MDFVDWCQLVLNRLVEASDGSLSARRLGLNELDVSRTIYGDEVAMSGPFSTSAERKAVLQALEQLDRHKLTENQSGRRKPSTFGQQVAADPTSYWANICEVDLKPEHAAALKIINRLSPQFIIAGNCVTLESVQREQIFTEFSWPDGGELLDIVVRELSKGSIYGQDLLDTHFFAGGFRASSNYAGLVWDSRRGLTLESIFIDRLIEQWENTNVDFKRERRLDNNDDKAKLIKLLIALANTQSPGQRWVIIGIDETTRSYWSAPDPKINQNTLEQLMAEYTSPCVDVRYKVVDYKEGRLGKLEVIRDRAKLPYRVAKDIKGAKMSLKKGQIFVRHGSQTGEPNDEERQAIQAEGDFAHQKM